MDLLIGFILLVTIFVIDPSPENRQNDKTIIRILVSLILLVKIVFSIYFEYYRLRYLKGIFLDNKDTFQIFVIVRMAFFLSFVTPIISACWLFLGFKELLFQVVLSIFACQEIIGLILIFLKMMRSSPSIQVLYIDRMYPQEKSFNQPQENNSRRFSSFHSFQKLPQNNLNLSQIQSPDVTTHQQGSFVTNLENVYGTYRMPQITNLTLDDSFLEHNQLQTPENQLNGRGRRASIVTQRQQYQLDQSIYGNECLENVSMTQQQQMRRNGSQSFNNQQQQQYLPYSNPVNAGYHFKLDIGKRNRNQSEIIERR